MIRRLSAFQRVHVADSGDILSQVSQSSALSVASGTYCAWGHCMKKELHINNSLLVNVTAPLTFVCFTVILSWDRQTMQFVCQRNGIADVANGRCIAVCMARHPWLL